MRILNELTKYHRKKKNLDDKKKGNLNRSFINYRIPNEKGDDI